MSFECGWNSLARSANPGSGVQKEEGYCKRFLYTDDKFILTTISFVITLVKSHLYNAT